jgi:hypothetical protein
LESRITTPLTEISPGKEALLEQMIVDDPAILPDRWLLTGRPASNLDMPQPAQ